MRIRISDVHRRAIINFTDNVFSMQKLYEAHVTPFLFSDKIRTHDF